MPQWANRAIADAESSVQAARPVNGQRLDQILAELKARPRSTTPPTTRETPRNVTPLHPPLMAELHSLQTRIDHLAEKMDAERLAAAITDLSDKVAALNAERSLGEAEMRLLRSIRRSLDDLIYHMTTATPEETVEPTLPPPAEPQMEAQPKVFGRRMVPPARQRPLHDDAIWPQPQSPAPRRVGDVRRGWHVSQLIARRPFMSVAAAFAAAIMVAAGVTQWMPFQPDNTGSIRTATTRSVNQDAAVTAQRLATSAIDRSSSAIVKASMNPKARMARKLVSLRMFRRFEGDEKLGAKIAKKMISASPARAVP